MGGGARTVSAVIVTRDRPELLRDALASVASQQVLPREVVIVDDGDRPVDPATLAGPFETRVLTCASRSAAAARNLGARAVTGDLIAFLDDDDLWLPDHLSGLVKAFAEAGLSILYRDAAVVQERIENETRLPLARRVIALDWDPEWMRHDDYIPPSALALRRARFEQLGGFDERFRFSEDWDLLLRAAALDPPRRVPGVTVEVRMGETGNASAERGPERRECLDRLAARHGLPPLEIKTFWDVAGDLASRAAR